MANQIIIDIGAAANDGTGDPLRTAFNYVNNNFSNVWNTGLPTSNISFSGNRILTINTNGNLILAPNGVGKVQANVDIVPNLNNAHSLGASDRRWNTVYTQFIDVSGDVDFSGDVTVSGNLTVEGDTIQIGNIVTDTKTIQLSNTAQTANAANGSGVTVGANDNIATMLYNSTGNTWNFNIGISAVGDITAPYFIGNGSQLTGITSYANANAVAYGESGWAGNIVPAGNNVQSLGNATNQWADIWVSNATIYFNSVPLTLTAGNVLTIGGQPILSNDSNTNISTSGNITADFFIGDGSQLSNVASTGNLEIVGTTIGIAPGASETSILVGTGPAGLVMNQDVNNLAYLKLSANTTSSNFYEESFDYSSGSYTSDGGSGGTITLTGATVVEQFLNNLGFPGSIVSLEINGTDTVPYTGASYGGGTVQLSTSTPPAVDPTVVTTIRFNIVYENQFVIDDDNNDFGIYIGDENFDIESVRDINITAGDDLRIRADDLFELSTNGTQIILETNRLGLSKTLTFDELGNIIFPGALKSNNGANNGYLTWVPNSSGDNNGYTTLKLVPDETLELNDQYLIVDPTVPSHIHIRAGGTQDNSSTALFLGGENSYFQVPAGANTAVYVAANSNSWLFDVDGTLSAPGNIFTFGNVSAGYFIGDGSQLTGLSPGYTDGDVANLLSSFGSNSISTTGNITGGNLLTSGIAKITTTSGGQGEYQIGDASSTSFVVGVGSAGATWAGAASLNLITSSSPGGNIGIFVAQNERARFTGTGMSVTGNANVTSNVNATGATFSGNVTAANFTGNISITGNVTGTQPNVTIVAGSYSYVFDNTGELTMPAVGGDEGGQINFTVPTANTTLQNKVTVDVYRDKIRFFEGSANANGVSLDLAKAPSGVGGELLWKVSGIVNAGTFVTLDNLKVTVTSSANYGLSIAAVSGSFTANISGWYGASGGGAGSSTNNVSVTTTPSSSLFGWNFVAEGDGAQYTIVDKTNSRMYRITLMIGSAYNNNFISIERLY